MSGVKAWGAGTPGSSGGARVRLLAFRLTVTGLVALGLVLDAFRIRAQLGFFAAGRMTTGGLALNLLLLCTGTPVAAILALSLVWRARSRVESRTLALFLALLAFFLTANVVWSLASAYHAAPWALTLLDTSTPAAGIAGVAALVRFSSVFPVSLRADQVAAPTGTLKRLRAALLRPGVVWGIALLVFSLLVVPAQLVGIFASHTAFQHPLFLALKLVVITLVLGALLAALANLRSGYRHADEDGRRRVFWLLEGFLAGGSLLVIASAVKAAQLLTGTTFMVAGWYPIVLYASWLVILAGLTIAMFFSGAVDPSLALRRTALFGLVGLTMVFVFAAVENAMQNVVAERMGLSAHVSGLLSGGVVALTFEPLKRRFDGLLERWSARGAAERADAAMPAARA